MKKPIDKIDCIFRYVLFFMWAFVYSLGIPHLIEKFHIFRLIMLLIGLPFFIYSLIQWIKLLRKYKLIIRIKKRRS